MLYKRPKDVYTALLRQSQVKKNRVILRWNHLKSAGIEKRRKITIRWQFPGFESAISPKSLVLGTMTDSSRTESAIPVVPCSIWSESFYKRIRDRLPAMVPNWATFPAVPICLPNELCQQSRRTNCELQLESYFPRRKWSCARWTWSMREYPW